MGLPQLLDSREETSIARDAGTATAVYLSEGDTEPASSGTDRGEGEVRRLRSQLSRPRRRACLT